MSGWATGQKQRAAPQAVTLFHGAEDIGTGWANIQKISPSWASRHSFLVRLGWVGLNLAAAEKLWPEVAPQLLSFATIAPTHKGLTYGFIGVIILATTGLLITPFEKMNRKDWTLKKILGQALSLGIIGAVGSFMFFAIMHLLGQIGWPSALSVAYVAAVAFLSTMIVQMIGPTPGARISRPWKRGVLAIVAFAALLGAAQADVWDYFFKGVPYSRTLRQSPAERAPMVLAAA